MVTLSRNTALRCDVPPNTALRVRERIRPLYRESLGGFANPSGGQSLPLRGGLNSNQTLDSRPSSRDFNNADTAASRISYVWGPDLGSGTDGHTSWQKAGGVRGLLAVLGMTDNLKQFPLMDRLGNVTGYKKASVSPGPAVLDAVIEYDAFGREVRSTGPASDTMPFRFSTKYTDPESGLVYYGYRFYDPDRGRWVNRDPIGEKGGLNLYSKLRNKSLNYSDYLGLCQGKGKQEGFRIDLQGLGGDSAGPNINIDEAVEQAAEKVGEDAFLGIVAGINNATEKLVDLVKDAKDKKDVAEHILKGSYVGVLGGVVSLTFRCCVCGELGAIQTFESRIGSNAGDMDGVPLEGAEGSQGYNMLTVNGAKNFADALLHATIDVAERAAKACD